MTQKEKADYYYSKFAVYSFNESKGWHIDTDETKDAATSLIDELITENESVLSMLRLHGNGRNRLPIQDRISFLQEVKYEISKL